MARMRRRNSPLWAWAVVTLCTVFFTVPMLAMARFALQKVPVSLLGRDTLFTRWTFSGVVDTVSDGEFVAAALLSVRLGLLTVTLVLMLMVPTVVWLHVRAPRLRPLVEMVSTVPYVVPPIALVVGVSAVFRDPVPWLVASNDGMIPLYAVLCLPFTFRALDAGAAAMDLRTQMDASSSLGAGRLRTLMSVVLPGMRTSVASAGFLGFAVVMGEYAIASLLLRPTLPAYMVEAQGREPQGSMAVALLLLVVTSAIFVLINRTGRREGTHQTIGLPA